jgi:hypothetical protein
MSAIFSLGCREACHFRFCSPQRPVQQIMKIQMCPFMPSNLECLVLFSVDGSLLILACGFYRESKWKATRWNKECHDELVLEKNHAKKNHDGKRSRSS